MLRYHLNFRSSETLKMNTRLAAIVLLTFVVQGRATTSINCAKAHRGYEALICANEELSKADDALADAYHRAHGALASIGSQKEAKKAQQQLEKEEKEWLKKRLSKCADVACLRDEYQLRLATLRSYVRDEKVTVLPQSANRPAVQGESPLAAPSDELIATATAAAQITPSQLVPEPPEAQSTELLSVPPRPLTDRTQPPTASAPVSQPVQVNASDSGPAGPTEDKPKAMTLMLDGLVLFIGLDWLFCLVQGFRNRIVLYFDFRDVFFSVLGPLLFVAFWLTWTKNGDVVIPLVLIACGALCTIYSIVTSVHHNQSVAIGVAVAVFKLSISVLWLCLIFGQLKRRQKQTAGRIVFVLLAILMARLINGPDVYEERGLLLEA